MKVEYKSAKGVCIVSVKDGLYYYGDGKELNAFGISPNQFLRFNPYMDYIGDKNKKPTDEITAWIKANRKE